MSMDQQTFDQQLKDLKAQGVFHEYYTKKEVRHLPSVLHSDEKIFAMTSGFYDGTTWLVTVTDRRILFLDKGIVMGLKQAEISIPHVSSITHKIGLIFGEIHVSSSSGTAVIGQIPKQHVTPLVQALSNLVSKKPAMPQSHNIGADVAGQIERLAALREKGVITDEEFQGQKAKILAA